jgi:glyoxylase-like metal-dependent hydrolase (beta-lactamase superfamily II)
MTRENSNPRRVRPIVTGFFEKRTSSVQYVVADPETRACAIIDPVLDFDPNSGATATSSADALLSHIAREVRCELSSPSHLDPPPAHRAEELCGRIGRALPVRLPQAL